MAGHYIVTGDGGMGIYGSPSNPTGNTSVSLPIGQMYRVTVDQRSPYWVYCERQDDGSMRIASDRPIVPANVPSYAPPPPPAPAAGAAARRRAGAAAAVAAVAVAAAADAAAARAAGPAQESMPSCESGYTYPEPNNHRFVWGTCYAAHVATFDEISGAAPLGQPVDAHARQRSGRAEVPLPVVAAAGDRLVRQLGVLRLPGDLPHARSRPDAGKSSARISPRGDPSRIHFSGGVVGDNLGQFYGAVVSAIAPSRTQQGVVWAGTNDGKVWISRDAGKNWIDLTKNVNMPPWGLVRRIDASHFDPGTAYMAVDYHLVDNRDPYLFKTTDFGQTWTRIDGGAAEGTSARLHAVDCREPASARA